MKKSVSIKAKKTCWKGQGAFAGISFMKGRPDFGAQAPYTTISTIVITLRPISKATDIQATTLKTLPLV